MQKNNWFEVDVKGLRALQKGKPKTFVIRELIQNAWDENIKTCELYVEYVNGDIFVTVTDDSPEGFKNLRDAYTLFGDTSKRRNAEQRGRFNLGEKQLISVCDYASIETTKGTVIFDKKGRRESKKSRDKGTKVTIKFKGKKSDFDELVDYAKTLIVPSKIDYYVNSQKIKSKEILKEFESSLLTEIEDNGFLKRTRRKTKINILKEETSQLYEMGIPIMDIDCEFSVDVQQKVPLSFDRDSVNQTFLKELYVEVLNNSYEEIEEDSSSASWIRLAMTGKGVLKEAIDKILKNRYGDRFVVANPFDSRSVDEALSNGYHVIQGKEMSKEEWANIKEHDLIQSSSDLFGTNFTNAPRVEPDQKQKETADYAKRIAKKFLGFNIGVEFVKGGTNMVTAQYGGRQLTFNVSRLNNGFFDKPISVRTTDLILHELGHEAGHHTEDNYHKLITKLGAELTMLALKEPEFFGD